MPSTYSPDLRIELIANGEQSGTWGTTTNSNLGTLIEDAISGLASVSITTANQALTALNGAPDQARCAAVALTTTTTANFAVYVPPVTKLYAVKNNTAYVATVYASTVIGNTTAAGTGVAIPAGKSVLVRCDGTNMLEQFDYKVGDFGVGGNLAVTGVLSAPTAAAGTSTTQAATTEFVQAALSALLPSGVITMWSGAVSSIPTGWLLCNGASGTPDLRNRFIVGAGSTYAVAATGGSTDAVVVSHTHTATVTDPGHNHSYTAPSGIQLLNGGGQLAVYTTVAATTGSKTTGITVANTAAGVSGTNANLPPYYALAYIIKT